MAKREEQPNFEDYLAELNRPANRGRNSGANLSRAEFFRKRRYKIIRPPDKTPHWVKFLIVAIGVAALAGIIVMLYVDFFFLSKEGLSLFAALTLTAISLILFFAIRDTKSFEDDED